MQVINKSIMKTAVVNISQMYNPDLVQKKELKKIGFITQLYWLTWRIYIEYKRNSFLIFFRFFLYMVNIIYIFF
jgi:hypothetical protein